MRVTTCMFVVVLLGIGSVASGAETTNVLAEDSEGVYRCDLIKKCQEAWETTNDYGNTNMCGYTTNAELHCVTDSGLLLGLIVVGWNTAMSDPGSQVVTDGIITPSPAVAMKFTASMCKILADKATGATNTDEYIFVSDDAIEDMKCVNSGAATLAQSRMITAAVVGATVLATRILAR